MKAEITDFDNALLREIASIESSKIDKSIKPHHAVHVDIINHVNASLNRLYKAGKIHVGETINDKYISVINGEEAR